MQGKRKSPFVGNTVPLNDDSNPILYRRYVDPSDIVLSEPAPKFDLAPAEVPAEKKRSKKPSKDKNHSKQDQAPAAPLSEVDRQIADILAEAEEEPPKKKRKERWSDAQKEEARKAKGLEPKVVGAKKDAAGTANGTAENEDGKADKKKEKADKKEQKKKKKEAALRQLKPEERVSGPSNADEAQQIRGVLGFTKPDAPTRATFGFGFDPSTADAPPPSSSNGASYHPPAAPPVQQEEQAPSTTISTTSSEESGSDSEGEGYQTAQPLEKLESDSSSSEDNSSDSDDSSSSDEEDDKEGETEPKKKVDSSSSSDDDSSESDSDSDSDEDMKPQPTAAPVNAGNASHAPLASGGGAGGASSGYDEMFGEFVPRRVYVGGMPYTYHEGQIHEYWSYCGEIESLDILTFPDTGRFRGIVFITFTTEEGYNAALACDGEQCDGQTLKVQKCKWSAKDRAAYRAAAAAGGGQQQAPPQQQQQQFGAAAPNPDVAQYNNQQQQQQPAHNFAPPGEYSQPPQNPAPVPAFGMEVKKQYTAPAPKVSGYNVAYVGNLAYEADEAAVKALFEPYNVTKVRIHTDKDTGRPKGFAHVHVTDEESLDRAMELDGTNLLGRRIRVGYAQMKKEQKN